MKLRIYYHRSDSDTAWSFDFGTQETEEHVTGWELHKANAVGVVDRSIPSLDVERPRAWIQVTGVFSHAVYDGVLHVFGEEGK